MSRSKLQPPSRRQVVSAGGASLAFATSTAALAQPSSSPDEAETLRDPKDKYPKPPFKRQSQPWPGLASRMDPRPDHGEATYRGSSRLAGRKALVTGGDSGMGRAAAIAFAREGATVIATDIDEKGIASLAKEGIAETARLDVRSTADVDAFAKRTGKIDVLLNAAGFVLHETCKLLNKVLKQRQKAERIATLEELQSSFPTQMRLALVLLDDQLSYLIMWSPPVHNYCRPMRPDVFG